LIRRPALRVDIKRLVSEVPFADCGMHRLHRRIAAEPRHDLFGPPPLDPDHHQGANRQGADVGPGQNGEARNLSALHKAVHPAADRGPAQPQPCRQIGKRRARIPAQLGHQKQVRFVHFGEILVHNAQIAVQSDKYAALF
jgi:hypothetical protein